SLSVLGKGEKISEKSLRWILPADAWQESEGYLAKGYYFRISSDVGGRRYLGGVEGIKIYEEPELKGNFSIITYKWISDKNNKSLCEYSRNLKQKYDTEQLLVCDNFCRKIDEEEKDFLLSRTEDGSQSYIPTFQTLLSRVSFDSCKIKFNTFTKVYSTDNGPEKDDVSYVATNRFRDLDWETNFYLKTDDTDFKKGYITLKDKDKNYYLDVRFCLKDPQFCRFVNIEKSEYERDLERLEKIKKEKSFARLNTLIKELRPCVLKKDKECIK